MTHRIIIVSIRDIQLGDKKGHLTEMSKLTSTKISPLPKKIKDLDARIDAINTGVKALVTMDVLIRKTDPPFKKRVMKVNGSFTFKLPSQLRVYKGKTDPMDH